MAAEDGSTAARIIAVGEDESDMLAALAEALGLAEADATAAERRAQGCRVGTSPATLRCMCRPDR